jgi:hypothetical protein
MVVTRYELADLVDKPEVLEMAGGAARRTARGRPGAAVVTIIAWLTARAGRLYQDRRHGDADEIHS